MDIDPEGIYNSLERGWTGKPIERSEKLWELRRATRIAPHNPYPEIILEKSVAMLAQRKHMSRCYFNQCPTASGIFHPTRDRRSAVDLVYWSASKRRASLMELKWRSDEPCDALLQVVRYGMIYLFCRVHRSALPLSNRPLMDADHIALGVVAPKAYYDGFDGKDLVVRTGARLDGFAKEKTDGNLSMSLHALAFPDWFSQLPFENGREAQLHCDRDDLTDEARTIRDAFLKLTTLWPSP